MQDVDNDTTRNHADEEDTSTAVAPEQKTDLAQAVEKAFDDVKAKTATDTEDEPSTQAVKDAPQAKDIVEPTQPLPDDVDPISGNKLEPVKAPNGLPPVLKERWKDVPRKLQEWTAARERDHSVLLQESAEDRKFSKSVRDIAAPYEPLLKQHNIDFLAHTKNLLEVSAALATAPQEHRAFLIDRFIRTSLNEQGIAALGRLSQGQAVSMPPMQPAPAPQKSPEEIKQQLRQELATEDRDKADQAAIDRFFADPKNEFADFLRAQMSRIITAELVDVTAPAEQQLAQAYQLAMNNSTEVKEALAMRAPAQPAVAAAPAQKPKPVNSVKNSLGGGIRTGTGPKKHMSLDDAILASLPDDLD